MTLSLPTPLRLKSSSGTVDLFVSLEKNSDRRPRPKSPECEAQDQLSALQAIENRVEARHDCTPRRQV